MEKIPQPLLFNPYKHHLVSLIKEAKISHETELEMLHKKLKTTGQGIMDLYTGLYSLHEIMEYFIQYLKKLGIIKRYDYQKWINNAPENYQVLSLPDQSEWTFRLGSQQDRFIHFHPCRYTKHTIRVRAASLKTAGLVHARSKLTGISVYDLNFINDTRVRFANLSPVQRIQLSGGIGMMINKIETLENQLQNLNSF